MAGNLATGTGWNLREYGDMLGDMSRPDTLAPDCPSRRWDRLLLAAGASVMIGGALALWLSQGSAVFAEAVSGLWALCF